jgi:hypothetical protein
VKSGLLGAVIRLSARTGTVREKAKQRARTRIGSRNLGLIGFALLEATEEEIF